MSLTGDSVCTSYTRMQYLARSLAIVAGIVMWSAGVLTGLITWLILFFAIGIYSSIRVRRPIYPYIEQHYPESTVHWVKNEQMGILPIFYSVGVIIFAIFWYGIASLGSGYCTNSMAEANLLVIALFLLMFPVLFEFLYLQTPVDSYVVPEDVKETVYLGKELFEEHYRMIVVHALFRDHEVEMSFLRYGG